MLCREEELVRLPWLTAVTAVTGEIRLPARLLQRHVKLLPGPKVRPGAGMLRERAYLSSP